MTTFGRAAGVGVPRVAEAGHQHPHGRRGDQHGGNGVELLLVVGPPVQSTP